jgi:phospholipid/cholesterol/gamma-HCH transport system ATP-binding protein
MIQIKNLWKRYGNVDVLQGLDLDVAKGEILVILGRSGVGKSVLLRHIIGLDAPDQGTIDVDGVRITDYKKKETYRFVKNMGMLFQGSALFDSMNLEENTGFYLSQHHNPATNTPFSKEEIKEKISQALKMVGLEGCEKKMPSDLSGGMRKRAALARLIVYRPSILLYDEPTTGLDPMTAQHINELIVQIQSELQGTSIIVTHDIHSALFVANRLALHRDGKIAYLEKPEEFIKIDDPMVQSFIKNGRSQ